MRRLTVTLFEYRELAPPAQAAAREWYRTKVLAKDTTPAELVTEHAAQRLADLGYPSDDIRFRLGGCQGDGLAFYGLAFGDALVRIARRVLSRLDAARIERLRNLASLTVQPNGLAPRYAHENTMEVRVDLDARCFDVFHRHRRLASLLDRLRDAVRAEIIDVSKALAREGYGILENCSSDEAVATAMDDLFEFTADGRVWH